MVVRVNGLHKKQKKQTDGSTDGMTGQRGGVLLRHKSVGAHLYACPCGCLHICIRCRCVGTIPPQALLAVEIEGVLCTAGM